MKSSGIPYWVVGVLAVLALPLLDPLTRARFWNAWVIEGGFPRLMLAIICGLITWTIVSKKFAAAVVIGVIGLCALLFYSNARSYSQLTEYAATVQETQDPMPALKERARSW